MASLLTKVRRCVSRRHPALTVRRAYDPYYVGIRFDIRTSSDARSTEHLGSCDDRERDDVLRLCRDGGYAVEEMVEGRHWLCRPESSGVRP